MTLSRAHTGEQVQQGDRRRTASVHDATAIREAAKSALSIRKISPSLSCPKSYTR